MTQLNVLPDSEGPGFSGLDLSAKRDGLRKISGLVAYSGKHMLSVNENDVPFGLGLDMLDVQDWVLYDRANGRWAGAHWERGLFNQRARFTTTSFSDACTFFVAEFGRWGNLFDMLQTIPGQPKHIYADAMSANIKTGQFEIDIRAAFRAVEKRFMEHGIIGRLSTADELVGAKAKLFLHQGMYCIEAHGNSGTKNKCWFSNIGLALKAFILVAMDRSVIVADRQSIFYTI